MKIANIVGARPNFVKIAPVLKAMRAHPEIVPQLIHTGQHYDYAMSQSFFEDLAIPDADFNLEVGSGSHAEQTAAIMIAFERYCLAERPDLVLVVGDVNSTIACALAAKKLGIAVAHVEAGLRSRDMTMPEEINRRCTDAISDLLFASEPAGVANLRAEGVPEAQVHLVGNVMIDTLFAFRDAARALEVPQRLGVPAGGYGVVTLHRPSNTDDAQVLEAMLRALVTLSQRLPIVFPIHPRTRAAVTRFGLDPLLGDSDGRLKIVEPLRYLEFIGLLQDARLVMTDSGGLQEETTALGVPCLTMRENTERPITIEQGTNRLIGQSAERLREHANLVLDAPVPDPVAIPYWDGRAAERIARILIDA